MEEEEEKRSSTPFACDLCSYETARKEHLAYHKKNVHPGAAAAPLKCAQCDYCTYTPEYLRKHVRRKHSEAPRPLFSCSHAGCTFASAYKANVQHHERCKHDTTGSAAMVCQVCGFSTPYIYSYNKHCEAMHGMVRAPGAVPYRNSYACEHCDFSAKRYYLLRKHVEEKHAAAAPAASHDEDGDEEKTPECSL